VYTRASTLFSWVALWALVFVRASVRARTGGCRSGSILTLSPDFINKFTPLEWNCLTHGVSLAALEFPFTKSYIHKKLQEDLDMCKITKKLLRKWKVHFKKCGLQDPIN
jgi:hypothetical protein